MWPSSVRRMPARARWSMRWPSVTSPSCPTYPGTTRDVLEVRLNLKGYPVILSDTAGLREGRDPIERGGHPARPSDAAEAADLRLLVLDGAAETSRTACSGDIEVWSKADLVTDRRGPGLWVSAQDRGGPGRTGRPARQACRGPDGGGRGSGPVPRPASDWRWRRPQRHLRDALEASAPELAAEHLRLALTEIGRLTGRVDLDELLDVVFRDFCIGK